MSASAIESQWSRERLIAAARAAAEGAYAPYSGFRVGAAALVETATGSRLVTGCNVENASYGLSLCAERAALAAACAVGGAREGGAPVITKFAVSCMDANADAPEGERMPCGACRQWLVELAPDAVVYVEGIEVEWRAADLLPSAFTLRRVGGAGDGVSS